MKKRKFLIERYDKPEGFRLTIDASKNKSPNCTAGYWSPSLSAMLQYLNSILMGNAKSLEQRELKVTVLFDKEKVEKVTVKEV
ncbi:MAG: hypothetical protein HKK66_03345 [Chlorobiaceae bacterium]|nr:hypothetical protein [Chlorobiaceae bacterium]